MCFEISSVLHNVDAVTLRYKHSTDIYYQAYIVDNNNNNVIVYIIN